MVEKENQQDSLIGKSSEELMGPAITELMKHVLETGQPVVVPEKIVRLTLPKRIDRETLEGYARNILNDPREDEIEQIERLETDEERWQWALNWAEKLAQEQGYQVDG